MTYVSRAQDGWYVEQGLSYYARTKSLALTPGHANGKGVRYRTFDPGAAILRCFQCHSTGTLSLGTRESIQPAELGVRCEACHGPGAAHIKAAHMKSGGSRSAITSPGRLSAAELNVFCGGCHRQPAPASADIDWSSPWNTRHQPLYFARSACFLSAKGALSCITCHAPHQALNRDAKFYGNICSGCHADVAHRASLAGKTCTECHMPPVWPRPELQFTNHWIGVYAPGDGLRPIAKSRE